MAKKFITGLLLAACALLILALLNVDYLAQRNKNYLLAKAGQSLGCNIAAKRAGVTLWPVSARLEDVIISDKPEVNNNEDWLRAKAMQIDLQLLPLLTGRFQAQKISLDSPVITILREDGGSGDRAHTPEEWIDVDKAASVRGIRALLATIVATASLR
jgi:uncharacterized protein involved in outer membrane biogenesis